ncbi:hypothetical protein CHH28_09360 [Bacterioplanes sanyensis]|uniref:Porin domain-containing protein n=1 Tax=Bacterioplanes sanyensis TaxID=1249553 RepID=A0A222FIK8_9GAMM|nr:hypothetical protein [Bacterioplanes sanyensis]ASP38877.1 hypothetical protein CHH28_09360 [Bacterioplanes sanyensis]
MAVASALTVSSTAIANDLRINGFMNVTAGHLSSEDVSLGGYDNGVMFDPDTLVGLQLAKQVNDTTSATVQLISRGSDDFDTEASWAYVTYSASDNTDLRIGRLRTPYFHYSDFLEVGYAYNWIRPPALVYRLDIFSSINGVDATHRFSVGDADAMVQLYTGRYQDELSGYQSDLEKAVGLVASVTKGSLSIRASYHQADFSMDVDPSQAGPNGRSLDNLAAAAAQAGVGDDFLVDMSTAKFYQASVSYDDGASSVIAEWTALEQETAAFIDDSAYLVSAAHRFGTLTGHLTYVMAEDDLESGTVGSFQKLAESKESSIIVGVRYDYDSSTAVKFDVQHHDEDTINGQDGDSGVLYQAGMSLVF